MFLFICNHVHFNISPFIDDAIREWNNDDKLKRFTNSYVVELNKLFINVIKPYRKMANATIDVYVIWIILVLVEKNQSA